MNFSELLLRFYLIMTSKDAGSTSHERHMTTTPSTASVTPQSDVIKMPFTIYVEGNVGNNQFSRGQCYRVHFDC